MPETNLGSAVSTGLADAITDYSVSPKETEGASGFGETRWSNTEWTKQLGYYKTIPELGSVIDAKATWTIGKGYQADELTTIQLDKIKGFGSDTFNTILENMIRTYQISGDSFAEIITDDDGNVINLKTLNPGSIVIIANESGLLERFEQITGAKKPNRKIKIESIMHLCRNRVADEIHGTSMVDRLIPIILMKNEAMTDWKRVLHRNIDPMWIYHMDTDDPTIIAAYKAKQDAARGAGESMYVPKGVIVPELITTAANATLNPLAWIESLDAKFYEAAGVPKIIIGNSGEFTEASSKIAYLAFQQTIEEEQLYIEEQILSQLNLEIKLEFPASLENEMISDKPKAEEPEIEEEQAMQPNDTEISMEGNK